MVTPPHIPGTKKTFVMCLQKNKQSIPNPYSKQYKSGIENPVHKKSRMAYETQTYANWQTANSKAKNEEIAVLQKKREHANRHLALLKQSYTKTTHEIFEIMNELAKLD